MLERAKETTRFGKYTYIEYARFADDLVILIDGGPICEISAGARVSVQSTLQSPR